MFYSHESTCVTASARVRVSQLILSYLQVLTSREGGVATVWYAFALSIGPKSPHQIDLKQARRDTWVSVKLQKDQSKGHPQRRRPKDMQHHHPAGSANGIEIAEQLAVSPRARMS